MEIFTTETRPRTRLEEEEEDECVRDEEIPPFFGRLNIFINVSREEGTKRSGSENLFNKLFQEYVKPFPPLLHFIHTRTISL